MGKHRATGKPQEPVHINYVFLDVEKFTQNRSTETQAEIVAVLNGIVVAALATCKVARNRRIVIPTGDGMCIALLDTTPFDIHVQVALAILAGVDQHNPTQQRKDHRFQVRIGINANLDNIVTDINGRKNVAGAGINMASRIMSLADGGTILVGEHVHEVLSAREKYKGCFALFIGEIKHHEQIPVYQLVLAEPGLSTATPEKLRDIEQPLPRDVAWYIGMAIRYERLIRATGVGSGIIAWLWLKAHDSVAEEVTVDGMEVTYATEGHGRLSEEDQLALAVHHIPFGWREEFDQHLIKNTLSCHDGCFKFSPLEYRLVNEHGTERLKKEHPSIWSWVTTELAEEERA